MKDVIDWLETRLSQIDAAEEFYKDNGIAIPDGMHDKIRKKFKRAISILEKAENKK